MHIRLNTFPFTFFGGVNVLKSHALAMRVCEEYTCVSDKFGTHYVFKASFDTANRSSNHSYRGPGMDQSLKVFEEVKKAFDVPVITDVYAPWQAPIATDAPEYVRAAATHTLAQRGGDGAFREFSDRILAAQGKFDVATTADGFSRVMNRMSQ